MQQEMFTITLNEMLEARGLTMYKLSMGTQIPYSTLLRMSQRRGDQETIDLRVLSKICTALKCTPNDLLKHVEDEDDQLVRTLMEAKRRPKGRPKKAEAGKSSKKKG
jgi:DNA-binding Xre family transcriptional regulator